VSLVVSGGSTCAITPPDDNSSSASRLAADGIGSLRRFGPEALPARSAGCPILGGCAPGDHAGHVDPAVKQQTLPEALEYLWQGYPVAGAKH